MNNTYDDLLSTINENEEESKNNENKELKASIEDIMIDLHNNCEFMGGKLASIIELIKTTADEEIKASTNNYRKAYDTLMKVAIIIGVTNITIIILLASILIDKL